ncbi:unnamed protein product [Ilex paraguariensis]|uniref:Uncharacterized protein n=1 Tax=Ilex paraguariensis TaxID=185542 RepID=A0ABC8V092_9AQUA
MDGCNGQQAVTTPLDKAQSPKVQDQKLAIKQQETSQKPVASQAWMEWLMKKRKAFDQRGDMAIAAWAEQQQREMNLRARRLSRSKIDPEKEEKRRTGSI